MITTNSKCERCGKEFWASRISLQCSDCAAATKLAAAEKEFVEGGYDAFSSLDRGQSCIVLRLPTKRGQVSWVWKRSLQGHVVYGLGAVLLADREVDSSQWELQGRMPCPIPLEIVLRHAARGEKEGLR